MGAEGHFRRIARDAWRPLSSGMLKSITVMCGCTEQCFSMACRPFSASAHTCHSSTDSSRARSFARKSSTIKMRIKESAPGRSDSIGASGQIKHTSNLAGYGLTSGIQLYAQTLSTGFAFHSFIAVALKRILFVCADLREKKTSADSEEASCPRSRPLTAQRSKAPSK
jgi:hypothetical protein